jgi:hypothetical protein
MWRHGPQLRAIVGRAALRLATGRGHLPFADRAGCKRAEPEIVLDTDAAANWRVMVLSDPRKENSSAP